MNEFSKSENPQEDTVEIEREEQSLRNILTNYQKTLDAMAIIDGEHWKKRQESEHSQYNLKRALADLEKLTKKILIMIFKSMEMVIVVIIAG